MRSFGVVILALISKLYGLDAKAVQAIAKEPHSRDQLVEELKIFPEAREYRIVIRSGKSTDQLKASPAVIAKEKTVRGQYIVSRLDSPGAKESMIMVVNYEKESDTFKKTVFLSGGELTTFTGVADFKRRTIAWTLDDTQKGSPLVLSLESHSDDRSSWKETLIVNGKIMGLVHGVAVKVK